MTKRLLLTIKNPKNIYHEIAVALDPYKNTSTGFIEFIVEGTLADPIVGIKYTGRKLVKRELKIVRSNSALWGNLYDFEVVPYADSKGISSTNFTFENILRDFQEHKSNNEAFWQCIEDIYYNNTLSHKVPKTSGIDTMIYLLVLKWIWIEEDFNYRLNWKDINAPTRYVLLTRTGTTTSGGAGRAKFFAAMILLKHHFTFEQVKKIIPLY
ncbi:hypothetical protein D4Q76_01420 [archaeon]|nr:MAG: hypothetical protein D4Q76_01420 [archaeon]